MIIRGLLALLVSALSAYPATVYVLDGGSGSGTSWSDALDDLPATLVRGNLYYLGDGSYAARSFNVASSGTTTIEIRKATVADHGTSTGWSDAYGDGQAHFTDSCTITGGDYWIFNGNRGDYFAAIPYGIKISNPVDDNGWSLNCNGGGNSSLFLSLELAGPAGDSTAYDFDSSSTGFTAWTGSTNSMLSNSWVHGHSTLLDGLSYFVWSRNVLQDSIGQTDPFMGHATAHCNVLYFGFGAHDSIFENNYCANYNAEGVLFTSYNGPPYNIHVRGNVFNNTGPLGTYIDFPRGIEFYPSTSFTNIYVYNNTFGTNVGLAISDASTTSMPGCWASNNIAIGTTFSFNNIANGSNVVVTGSQPFIQPINGTNANYRLSATKPGFNLGITWKDWDGTTVGSDGQWNLGAFDFADSGGGGSSRAFSSQVGGRGVTFGGRGVEIR